MKTQKARLPNIAERLHHLDFNQLASRFVPDGTSKEHLQSMTGASWSVVYHFYYTSNTIGQLRTDDTSKSVSLVGSEGHYIPTEPTSQCWISKTGTVSSYFQSPSVPGGQVVRITSWQVSECGAIGNMEHGQIEENDVRQSADMGELTKVLCGNKQDISQIK